MHRRLSFTTLLIVGFVAAGTAAPLAAQGLAAAPPDLLDRLTFRSIGPATMGGRVDDVAVLESDPRVFYIGAATGGVWKTANNGTTWEPVFDLQDVASVGAVALAQDDADIVWVGTGEDNNRQSSSWGAGIYKSVDGGGSWQNMGLADSRHIGRIVIDPTDHDVVYVAASGHLWGPNPERGVYKTTDGGATWTKVLFVDDDTGASDLVMDPSDPQVLYAAMYQRRRSVWGFNGGGPGSGLYKSTDAGATWMRLGNGLPAGPLGRLALTVYRSDPRIVYALIESDSTGGVYRSDDGGGHWTRQGDTDPRPSYFSQIRVDPGDASRVYVLGVRVMISDDAGKTFREVRLPSTGPDGGRPRDDLDVHAMWIDPANPAHLVIGADVGVATSYDRGATWLYLNNLPLGQFYHVGYDMETPYRVYGGLQDNDVWTGPSNALDAFGIGNRDWQTLTIGDGFVTVTDPTDARIVYGETQNGSVSRIDRETGQQVSIRPRSGPGEPPLRWAWNTPFLISPHDPNTLLIAAQKVFRSTDRGNNWTPVSPDLTGKADRDTLSLMGVRGRDFSLSAMDGISAWPTVVSLTESPRKAGVYYAGTDDGRVQVSLDGGGSWSDVTDELPGLPAGAVPEGLAASAFDDGTVYATFDNHAADDYAPYVYVGTRFGHEWKSLASALPAGQVANCVTEDPRNPDVLYLGTESGLWLSLDRGGHWMALRNNLPTVPIDEITIQPRDNDMLLATHGRSIWILDDLTPIQEAARASRSQAYLFGIDPAAQLLVKNDFAGYPGDGVFWGQNPRPGATISWYLRAPAEKLGLTIRDATGTVVREMPADELQDAGAAGLNMISWDLRHQPVPMPGSGARGGPPRFNRSTPGPHVLPGAYTVELSVDGRSVGKRTVSVSADPRLRISDEDRVVLHDATLTLHELQRVMNQMASILEAAASQVDTVKEILRGVSSPPALLVAAADSVDRRLAALEDRLGEAPRFTFRGGGGDPTVLRARVPALERALMSWTERPTDAQLRQAAVDHAEVTRLADDLNVVLARELPGLYDGLRSAKLRVPLHGVLGPVVVR